MAKPYFQPLIIGGKAVDLAHLQPFSFNVDSVLAKKSLRIHVTFSNHCFTKAYDPESHPLGTPIFDQSSSRPRTFCPVRYSLSMALPGLIQGLDHPKAKVSETAAERNWAYSIKIDDPQGPYHVFFELRRANEKPQDLTLFVESAYHEDPEIGPPRLKGSMSFLLLCGKVFQRQPTSTKR